MWRGDRVMFIGVLASLVAGCSGFSAPTPTETAIGPKILNSTASVRNTFIVERDSTLVICSEPPPDATFDQHDDIDLSLALVSTDSGDSDEGSEEAEMSGRSPALLLARELLFRLCEFTRNQGIDRDLAVELYKQNLDLIREVSGKEAEHTAIRISDAVTNSDTVTVDQRAGGSPVRRQPPPAKRDPYSRDTPSSWGSSNSPYSWGGSDSRSGSSTYDQDRDSTSTDW